MFSLRKGVLSCRGCGCNHIHPPKGDATEKEYGEEKGNELPPGQGEALHRDEGTQGQNRANQCRHRRAQTQGGIEDKEGTSLPEEKGEGGNGHGTPLFPV